MQHQFGMEYQHIVLRPLAETDIEELRLLRNKNLQWFFDSNPITAAQQQAWFKQYVAKDDDIMFAIELSAEQGLFSETQSQKAKGTFCAAGGFIGAAALFHLDKNAKTAEFGRIMIDKEKAPMRGIGTEATTAVCQLGFTQLGLKKITLVVLKQNLRAYRTYIKTGFVTLKELEDGYYMELTPETIRLGPPVDHVSRRGGTEEPR